MLLIKGNGETGDDGTLYLLGLWLEGGYNAELGVDLLWRRWLAEWHARLDLLELLVGEPAGFALAGLVDVPVLVEEPAGGAVGPELVGMLQLVGEHHRRTDL